MRLLDKMDSYLGVDELEDRQKLLDTISYEPSCKPFYMVGRRPLNSKGGSSAFKISPSASHEHFIHSEGAGNFDYLYRLVGDKYQ